MLNLYSYEKVEGLVYVRVPDVYFDEHWQSIIKAAHAEEIMSCLDKISSFTDTTITTPYGITDYKNLSSGCKALLTANYNKKLLVSLVLAGDNVLDLAARLCYNYEDLELNFYINSYLSFLKSSVAGTIRLNGEVVKNRRDVDVSSFKSM